MLNLDVFKRFTRFKISQGVIKISETTYFIHCFGVGNIL